MKNLNEKFSILINDRSSIDYYLPFLSKDWLIGFIEAEGGFYGKGRHIVFSISQHLSDWHLLVALNKFLGEIGNVVPTFRKDGRLGVELVINDREKIKNVIIPLMSNNIRTIKKLNQFNGWIKEHFDHAPTERCFPLTKEWLTGFVDGDGSFFVKISKSSKHKCGYNVRAAFDITQIDSERDLLISIGNTFFKGVHTISKSGSVNHLVFTNLNDLISIVEPFFKDNQLLTRKYLDFIIWQEILNLIEQREHFNSKGVLNIQELRSLQHHHRRQIHSTVIDQVLSIRPHWKDSLFSALQKAEPTQS